MTVLSLPLLMNFVGRVQAEARVAAEVQRRAAQVLKSETTVTQLREAVEYARSDVFTERYAREQARYAKPGEVVVVPPGVQDPAQPHRPWWEDFVTPDADATAQPGDKGQ
jgi:hypothetical protein